MAGQSTIFSADVIHGEGSVVLRLSGELDIATAPLLRRAIAEVVGPRLRAVIVDLAGLHFLDVYGSRALADARHIVIAANARFELRSPSAATLRVIRLVDLDGLAGAAGSA